MSQDHNPSILIRTLGQITHLSEDICEYIHECCKLIQMTINTAWYSIADATNNE